MKLSFFTSLLLARMCSRMRDFPFFSRVSGSNPCGFSDTLVRVMSPREKKKLIYIFFNLINLIFFFYLPGKLRYRKQQGSTGGCSWTDPLALLGRIDG